MDINSAFPSKYIKAADLQGQDVEVVLERVQLEDLAGDGKQDDYRPVAYFSGYRKGLVLNKTNANTLSNLYGSETDHWVGRAITLYPTEVQFGAEMKPCVRIRSTVAQQPQPMALQQSVPQPQQPVQPPVAAPATNPVAAAGPQF